MRANTAVASFSFPSRSSLTTLPYGRSIPQSSCSVGLPSLPKTILIVREGYRAKSSSQGVPMTMCARGGDARDAGRKREGDRILMGMGLSWGRMRALMIVNVDASSFVSVVLHGILRRIALLSTVADASGLYAKVRNAPPSLARLSTPRMRKSKPILLTSGSTPSSLLSDVSPCSASR